MVGNLRDRALFDSERELKNTALILAEQIDRSFQAVDLVQSSVIEKIQSLGIASSEDYARRMSGEDVHLMLKASTSGLVQIYAISLINADGRLINFSRFWPVPEINVADRDFFKALKSDAAVDVVHKCAWAQPHRWRVDAVSRAARSRPRMASF